MAIGILKSENVTALEAGTVIAKNRGNWIIDKVSVPVTSSDDVGDIILFGPFRSTDVIVRLGFLNDSLAASGLAYNVGIYYSGIGGNQKKEGKTSGTVVDADNIGTAVAFSTARVVLGDVRFEAADIVNIGKELWEVAGLTTDVGGNLYIGLTCSTVATTPAVGDIVMVAEVLPNS
jgi:hypothetical protein